MQELSMFDLEFGLCVKFYPYIQFLRSTGLCLCQNTVDLMFTYVSFIRSWGYHLGNTGTHEGFACCLLLSSLDLVHTMLVIERNPQVMLGTMFRTWFSNFC